MTANSTAPTFSTRSIFSAGALVFAASMILSIGGFGFHAIASRRLGVNDYGAVYALISAYSLAVIPISLLTPVVAKYAAEFRALHDNSHVRGLIELIVRWFSAAGLVYVAAAVVFSGPLAHFLHVERWAVPIIGIMSAVGIFSGALRAVGQGVHDYTGYGLSMTGEGIAKVAAIAIFAFIGLTVSGAASAFVIAMAIGALLIALPLARSYGRVVASPIVLDWRRILATTTGAASLTITMALMGFGDVVIVKHFFSAHEAGLYSAASLCGKILLYLVGFVPAVLIPQATHRHARGERTRLTLWMSIAFVALVSLVGVVAYRIAGGLLLHALVGTAFNGALDILPTYAAAMAFLALTNTLGSYALATHRLTFVAPLLLATVGTLVAIIMVHPSLGAVVDEFMLGNAVMFVAVAAPLAIEGRRALATQL
jgi:O-antigen/teichoic acid export membrane protein